VKDLLSLVRLAENPRDIVSGRRALCLLPGIGLKKADDFLIHLNQQGGNFDAWNETKVPAKSKDLWPRFAALMRSLASTDAAQDLRHQIHLAIAFYEPLLEQNYENAAQRLADLEQLEQLAARFPDRATLLADLAIDPPTSTAELPRGERRADRLVLSTMHSAKGLQWPVVYVLHATEGKIPSEYSVFDPERLEEERRLFYVALTRAADWLYVCHPLNQSPAYGKGWGEGFAERCELTRLVSPSVKRTFQQQEAGTFEAPEPQAPIQKPCRKPRKRAAKRRSPVK
jgi:DNA helicase-2/ATP-dependent DNA helicase PcrA